MVTHSNLHNIFDPFRSTAIGFDSMFETLASVGHNTSQQGYPPYNIIKHDDDRFSIELAVAGFSKEELDVEVKENKVTITGEKNPTEEEARDYVHKGIGTRRFQKAFSVAEFVEVEGADLVDGVLVIDFVRLIPEQLKPRKVVLGSSKKTLLQEGAQKVSAK
tara:strand:+ start:9325 stop:9810 length:486 start_codon:yes stop_codon:yes gene_type:complete